MLFKRIGAFFLDILEVVVFAVAIFLFIYLLIMQPHKIKGASMEPNFPDGEYLLTDKLSYRFNEPNRGDVIVFEAPGQQGEEYIKRIIALPGEKVLIMKNQIIINGNLLNESYIPEKLRISPGSFIKEGQEIIVPSNNYFVLGDNRPFSSDSRAWGTVSKEMITGRAWIIYWPINSLGKVEKVEY
jgi:signal peptidase I